MKKQRRTILQAGASALVCPLLRLGAPVGAYLGLGILSPRQVLANEWHKNAFTANQLAEAQKLITGTSVTESKEIRIQAPEVAENGAVVPVEVSTTLGNVQGMILLAERNPMPLAASFELSPGVLPYLRIPLKLAESTRLRALIKADGKFFGAWQEVKVTTGGCGG